MIPDVYSGASLGLKAKGPTMFPAQYETKNRALTTERLVEPAVLAVMRDMIMENDAVYVLVSYRKKMLARDLDYGKVNEHTQ